MFCVVTCIPLAQAIAAGLVQQHGLDPAQLAVQLLLPGMRHPPAAAGAAVGGPFPWVLNTAVILRQAWLQACRSACCMD